MNIEWDPAKAAANVKANDVGFAEAATVLTDDFALTREDPDSLGEQRFVTMGMSATGALLVLVYTHREPDAYRIISAGRRTNHREPSMKKPAADPVREIDFSKARRGAVIKMEPGKTKISIRLDNTVIEYFRGAVEKAGSGNYQTLINDALLAYIQQRNVLDAVRQVVREELAPARAKARPARSRQAAAPVG